MSRPSAGTYVIVNRVLSPKGQSLAITSNGEGKAATVTVRTDSGPQRWIIKDYDAKTQSVTPVDATGLQAASSFGKGYIMVLPAGGYVWTIRETDTGYTIQDGGVTKFWGVENAVDCAEVTITSGTGNEKQRWMLEKMD